MRRGCTYLGRVALVLALGVGLGGGAGAWEDAPAPAGVRVFYTGHSFHMFVPRRVEQLARSAGIEGHRTAGAQGIGGSRVIQHWELPDERNQAKAALAGGEVDVFTMAAHLLVPDPGIDKLTELGLKHNPNLRLLVQVSWMPWDLTAPDQRLRDNAERDHVNLDDLAAATVEWRTKLQAQADELNRRHGREAVSLVPVGDAVVKLRRLVAEGKFPGVVKQADLFTDPIGHVRGHIQALTAYCTYAAIYDRSPAGLTLNEPGVTDEQHAILQRLAWETIAEHQPAAAQP